MVQRYGVESWGEAEDMIFLCAAKRLLPGDILVFGILGREMIEKVEPKGTMRIVNYIRLGTDFRSSFTCNGNAKFYIERN